jgi:AraC-like DNA-binding protein
MPTGGATTFTDSDDYRASVAGARVDLVFTHPGDFKARLTWVKLPNLRLFSAKENLPRIAYVSLAPEFAFIGFPTQFDPPPVWKGVELQRGDIVFHSRGEHMHQRTSGPSQWSLMSLLPQHLAAYGKILTEQNLVPPPVGRVLRPPTHTAARLRRLHAKACHVAETRPDIIAQREAARALEHDLLHALVNCLTAEEVHDHLAARRYHANIMIHLEKVLAAHVRQPLSLPELCAAIGVSDRTLRLCCAEFLGMSPSRYLLLRRLNMVWAALRHSSPATATVAEHARRYGFTELGRFAGSYRAVFGETPSTTLRGSLDRSMIRIF